MIIYRDGQPIGLTREECRKIYDEMCRILTEYENDNDMITEYDLYDMLVKIQNNWETIITVQEEC